MKILRGLFVSAAALAALFAPLIALAAQKTDAKGEFIVYVGTYTREQEGRGRPGQSKGIYAYRFQPATGKIIPIGLVAETVNPSFLALHPNQRFLYAVNEIADYAGQSAGSISAFSIDAKTAALTFLNIVSSRGAEPCHLSLDKTGKRLLVANYSGGSIAAFPVRQDGSLGDASAFVQHSGSSVNPRSQAGPHAHSIILSSDNRFAVVADKGLDEVLVYRMDAAKGALTPNDPPFAKVTPGSGPRHLAFHPNGRFLYEISEMKSEVSVFDFDPARGSLGELQTISALPPDFKGRSSAAEIEVHRSGKFLYSSNRGHNSIAVFAVDARTGTLTPVEYVPTEGRRPRNFAIDPTGAYLFVAHQDSGNIVIFRIDQKTGKLTPTGTVLEIPVPVCVTFVAAR